MNYLKAAFAGLTMSIPATALCAAKVGTYHCYNCYGKIRKDVYKKILLDGGFQGKFAETLCENYTLDFLKNNDQVINGINWKTFQYDKYYSEHLKPQEPNYWYNKNDFSVARSLLINNCWTIPTALLGALFHDKVGRDLTPKINQKLNIDISPYLVTGGIFSALVTAVGEAKALITLEQKGPFDPTKPWIYSLSIIQGFLIGATAMAGAYFGDENNDNYQNNENYDSLEEVI